MVLVLAEMQSSVFSLQSNDDQKRLTHNLKGTPAIVQAFDVPVIISTMLEEGLQDSPFEVLETAGSDGTASSMHS